MANKVEKTKTDLDEMTLDDFKMWSEPALKAYLSVRKKVISGSFDELAARAFISWEDQAAVHPEEEHALRKNLEEYKARLLIGQCVVPDPFTLKEGWVNEEGRQNWPSVYFNDIANYLKMTTPSELYNRLCNEYKQGKAYRYFSAGLLKEVYYHKIRDDSEYAFLAAKVTPSMRRSNPPYEVWVLVKKDKTQIPGGDILTAYCTCTAGLKGCCNHVAAVLFRVEYAVRTGLTKPSSTSQKCVWNVPEKRGPSEPIKLCEQIWQKEQYFKQGDGDHSKSVRSLATEFTPLSKTQTAYVSGDIKEDIASFVRDLAPESCFIQLLDKIPAPKEKEVICPPSPEEIASGLGHNSTVPDLIDALKMSKTEIETLSEATVGQADNKLWKEQRIGRITASNFHRVFTRSKTLDKKSHADPSALIKDLMGYNKAPETIALKHGRSMEPHAKYQFVKLQKRLHKKFHSEEAGLQVDEEYPFIGSSPDLITYCTCCGKGLCEIKCPESIKDKIPSHNNYKHLIQEGNVSKLTKSSMYYTQIQGQMAIAGVKFCDLFVYTPKGHHLERILFNREYWDEVLTHLLTFWKSHIAVELINRTLSDKVSVESEDHLYAKAVCFNPVPSTSHQHTKASKGPLKNQKLPSIYLCGKCGDTISENPSHEYEESVECTKCKVWFHIPCSKANSTESVVDEEWLCQFCKEKT